jgi:hypothetical protein
MNINADLQKRKEVIVPIAPYTAHGAGRQGPPNGQPELQAEPEKKSPSESII